MKIGLGLVAAGEILRRYADRCTRWLDDDDLFVHVYLVVMCAGALLVGAIIFTNLT